MCLNDVRITHGQFTMVILQNLTSYLQLQLIAEMIQVQSVDSAIHKTKNICRRDHRITLQLED